MLIHHEIDRVICVIAMSTAYKVIALIYIICHIHNYLSVNMHFTSKIMIIFPMIYFRVKYKTKNAKGIYIMIMNVRSMGVRTYLMQN